MTLADAPQWVIDGKTYLGFFVALLAAVAGVWRYAIKPYLEHREAERKRDIAEAAALRKSEIDAAVRPLKSTIERTEAKVDRLSDAISGANSRIDHLVATSAALSKDVRAHMQAEDEARQRNQGDGK